MEQPRFNKSTGELLQGIRVNPNKYLYGDNGYITSYSQLISTVDEMLLKYGMQNYAVQRVDFRVDNYDNTFDEIYKLNNIIVNVLAIIADIDNCYKSVKGNRPHNIVARDKNNHMEIECYNRIAKDGDGIAKTRLEFRKTFAINKLIPLQDIKSVADYWLWLLNNRFLLTYYKQFQSNMNDEIVKAYQSGTTDGTVRSHIGLFASNKDIICTSRQMTNLCSMLNLTADVGYTYKNRLKIAYYNDIDIQNYIDTIISAFTVFLSR